MSSKINFAIIMGLVVYATVGAASYNNRNSNRRSITGSRPTIHTVSDTMTVQVPDSIVNQGLHERVRWVRETRKAPLSLAYGTPEPLGRYEIYYSSDDGGIALLPVDASDTSVLIRTLLLTRVPSLSLSGDTITDEDVLYATSTAGNVPDSVLFGGGGMHYPIPISRRAYPEQNLIERLFSVSAAASEKMGLPCIWYLHYGTRPEIQITPAVRHVRSFDTQGRMHVRAWPDTRPIPRGMR